MMLGEYEPMTALYKIEPWFVPRPMSWGTFEIDTELHFLLCGFHAIDQRLPNVNNFTCHLARMHKRSRSPQGKYGQFHSHPRMVQRQGSRPLYERFSCHNILWKPALDQRLDRYMGRILYSKFQAFPDSGARIARPCNAGNDEAIDGDA